MRQLRRIIYITILVAVAAFLVRLGKGPWQQLLEYKTALLIVFIVTAVGLMVQSKTYLLCLDHTAARPSFLRLLHIWSGSAAMSLITPLLPGLTLRIGILKLHGLAVRTATVATIRQALANLDIALLISGLFLLIFPVSIFPAMGWFFLGAWIAARLLRPIILDYIHDKTGFNINYPGGIGVALWMAAQTLLVTLNFLLVYSAFGVELGIGIALLLTLASLFASVLTLIPNGIGLLDALWVYIATYHQLDIDEGVAVALTFRLGGLLSSIVIFLITSFIHGDHEAREDSPG